MSETTERTETSKKVISDPFKEFKIVGFSGGIELTRDWKVCTECALVKRMQRRLARETEQTAKESGGRMFLVLASLNLTTMGGNRHIGLLVDEYSRLKFDIYISTKNQLTGEE